MSITQKISALVGGTLAAVILIILGYGAANRPVEQIREERRILDTLVVAMTALDLAGSRLFLDIYIDSIPPLEQALADLEPSTRNVARVRLSLFGLRRRYSELSSALSLGRQVSTRQFAVIDQAILEVNRRSQTLAIGGLGAAFLGIALAAMFYRTRGDVRPYYNGSLGTASITATATDAGGASQSVTVTVTESETLIWNWNSAGPHFDMTSGAVTFDGKTMVSRGGSKTPEVDGSFILSDGRFNIGSATLDTTLATAADVNVDDGEFNFTSTAKIVLTYSAYSNTDGKTDGFRFYLNNNTTSESKSVLYRAADELADPPVDKISPILSPDTALSEAGGTVEYLIDPAYFEQNSESLANAFIQLRADSKTSITITAISIEYVND